MKYWFQLPSMLETSRGQWRTSEESCTLQVDDHPRRPLRNLILERMVLPENTIPSYVFLGNFNGVLGCHPWSRKEIQLEEADPLPLSRHPGDLGSYHMYGESDFGSIHYRTDSYNDEAVYDFGPPKQFYPLEPATAPINGTYSLTKSNQAHTEHLVRAQFFFWSLSSGVSSDTLSLNVSPMDKA
ncbi:hypothetical protein K438DRAFT_1765700 [Mycena galopus ATCC 62051]|nr:hypothetical protein K438DRAFT_1765700 [Mycena galopus ATCC 62051]